MKAPRRVLLVDTDVDALGQLASSLRARGLIVANASDAFEAVEQAFKARPDVVLVERRLDDEQDVVLAFEAVPELQDIAVLHLVPPGRGAPLSRNEVLRSDVDRLVSRIATESPRVSDLPLDRELRGTLEQMSVVDLLQLLAMNRRSGVLGVATANGAGEVRVSEGNVVDAVYRRLEGEKAFYRMLAVEEGRFAFSPGEPGSVKRLGGSTSHLLMEAMRQVDEVRRLRETLALGAHALASTDNFPWSQELSPTARGVLQLLAMPRSIDDLLDEHPATDLEILEAVERLERDARLRRVPLADLTTPFAPPEQLPVLRSLVARLTRPGFAPPLRVVLAAAGPAIETLGRTVRRLSEVSAATDTGVSRSVPRTLGVLRLGDGVDLAMVGLPAELDFAPSWALMLPGAAALVRLGGAGGSTLEAHCEAVEVPVFDGESLLGAFDASAPEQLAALIRGALEMAAGVE